MDSFIKHQKPHCLSELQSIQLLDDTDTETPHSITAASDLGDASLAVRSQLSVSHRLSKKCIIDKVSLVKRQYCRSLSGLKQRHKHKYKTNKLSGKSMLFLFYCLEEVLTYSLLFMQCILCFPKF